MFISRAKKTVYVRVPKTGSTSGLFYFMRSGIYDPNVDLYAVEPPFYDWQEMYKHFKASGSEYLGQINEEINTSPNPKMNRCVHISFNQIIDQLDWVDDSFSCYAGIRNPIDRICSVYFYEEKRRNHNNFHREHFNYADVNEFCYTACLADAPEKLKSVTRLQTSYFPKHAKLWNIENFHEHADNDIVGLGGKVIERIHVRDNELRPKDYQALLSPEVVQMMELKYLKDFNLWEKAYAVYN
ncbi:sulfotransferase family 2 domain-containing protein [bacterium]|nr:sulfotransferase family 2 domain-containing protein [bacterium]